MDSALVNSTFSASSHTVDIWKNSTCSTTEIEQAIRQKKLKGPENIVPQLCKAMSRNTTLCLSEFFNESLGEGSHYSPIRLLYHTMNIFEHILANSIRGIFQITVHQVRLVKNCGTTDALHSAWLLVEKHQGRYAY